MSWGSAQDFFAMGGYAVYIWGSYAVATVCIVAELWFLRLRGRTLRRGPSRKSGDRGSDRAPRQT